MPFIVYLRGNSNVYLFLVGCKLDLKENAKIDEFLHFRGIRALGV